MKKLQVFRPIILVTVFFVVVFSFFLTSNNSNRLGIDTYNSFNEGWYYENKAISLPYDADAQSNEDASIKKILPIEFDTPQVILIRTSLQDIRVYVEGTLVYENTHEKINNMRMFASLWHTIELDGQSAGKEIEIVLNTPYALMSGRFNAVHYGSMVALHTYIIETFLYRVLIGIFVLLIGISIFLTNIVFFKKIEDKSALYGVFGIFLGAWIIAESRMLQFVTGSVGLIGSLAYIALAISPIPLVFAIKRSLSKRYAHIFNIIGLVFLTHFVLIVLFQVMGVADFFESVLLTQLWIVLAIIVTIIVIVYDHINYSNKSLAKAAWLLLYVAVIGLMELINFLLGNFDLTSVFAVSGIALLMGFLFILTIRDVTTRLKLMYEKELYQKLAYKDALTETSNRLSYEQDIENFYMDKDKSDITLIYFDFDNLKIINDKFGHLEGDKVIIEGYRRLNKFFSEYGNIYRVGGDEFVFLGLLKKKEALKLLTTFSQFLISENEDLDIKISISYGIAFYDEVETPNPKELMKKADYNMYLYKQSKKQNND